MSLTPNMITIPALPLRQTIYVICSTIVIQAIALYFCYQWFGDGLKTVAATGTLLAAMTVLPAASGVAWIWLQAVWGESAGWRGLGVMTISTGRLRLAVLAGAAAMVLNTALVILLRPILGAPTSLPIGGEGGMASQPVYVILAFFVGAVLLAPLLEELLFRGMLFGLLRKYLSFWPAALIAAEAHAMIHFDPATVPGLTVVFVIFGYLYEKYKSLWLPIIAHGTHNLLVLTIAFTQTG